MTQPHTAFVAYPSKDKQLLSTIREGVAKATARTSAIRFEPWEFNDIAGALLVSPIIEKIENASIVIADITYLNLNVVYEVGYAIGKGKRVFLIRHEGTRGDKDLAARVGIFDTLGYFEYDSSDALSYRLAGYIDERALDYPEEIDHKAPVYVVEPRLGVDLGEDDAGD